MKARGSARTSGPGAAQHSVRFGVFEADFESGELRKGGVRLRLPGQALEILQALIECPGELVTREGLRDRLWPGDTFVDFDHGLNVMVNKLRDVLGDSAKAPCYVETVPRRGYRFIAPLAAWAKTPPAPAVARLVPVNGASPKASHRRRRLWWAVPVLGILATGVWMIVPRPAVPQISSVVPITTFPGSKDFASFSPDGNQVAFAWVGPQAAGSAGRDNGRNRHIYVKLIDAGEPLRLTHAPDDELLPAWSPDGRHIAFLRKEGARQSVYLVPALGGTERRICEAGTGLAWSPDGKTLAIASPPDARGRNHIVLHSLQRGEERSLTRPEPYSDSFPAFSPDGRTVAFLRSFSISAREVMTVAASGGEPARLTFDERPVWGLAWTADGREIVYSANRGGAEALWRVRRAGGPPQRVMVTSQTAVYPAISRQGTRLAYTEEFNDSNIYLYAGPRFAASSALAHSTREDHSPQFSPDGERVVFVSRRTGSDEIWVTRRGGGSPAQLTSFAGPATGSPRWSPDGRWIAFDSRAGGSADIYIVDPEGAGLRRLTTESSEDVLPAWSGDGRRLYFASNRGGDRQIWKLSLEGESPAQVTRGGGYECFESPDGKLLYFTRDRGVAGIWSVSVNGGEEKPVPELAPAGYWRSWGVNREGLYFVSKEEPGSGRAIRMFHFATRRITQLLKVGHEPLWLQGGLALSQDGRWLLYAQLDHAVNDLMLIENFR